MGLLDKLGAALGQSMPSPQEASGSGHEASQPDAAETARVWELLSSDSGSHLYFLNPDHVQARLFDLVTRAPQRVLDVGCYCGAIGDYIKKRWPGATVIGIEPLPEAAALAAPRIDRVITGTLESVDFDQAGLAAGSIDTIVLADVLEHMYNPWLALTRLRTLLAPGGTILASIPNARNLNLIGHLAAGHWSYQGAGLLDITHIRFFTLSEIRKMFAQTGYAIEEVRHNVDPSLAALSELDSKGAPANVQFGTLLLQQMSPEDRMELATIQFCIRASPA